MKRTITILTLTVAVAAFAGVASAAGPNVPWTLKDMKAAIRAVGYPRPHAKTLTCKGYGAGSFATFASFRCVETYPRHRRSVFYIEGEGEGGWLCAGRSLAGCRLLRHGFVTSRAVRVQGLAASADRAARGYMTDRFGAYQAKGFCKQQSSSSWSCPFVGHTVVLTLVRKASGGYVSSATIG